MRTVHETEALRPSDPVPKHHSSNPSNKFQRLRLVLNERQKQEKGSTPASPSSHPPNSATVPLSADAEYAHNNVVYMQDPVSPNAPTMVQFPPDLNFTEHELSLPAPELFRLLRRQLHWATQEGEQLRAEAEALEKLRKEAWVAKELTMENLMEEELTRTRRQRVDAGVPDEAHMLDLLEEDIAPAKRLEIKPKAGKLPWWRGDGWVKGSVEVKEPVDRPMDDVQAPEARQEVLNAEAPGV
jgi:hypothetical protein